MALWQDGQPSRQREIIEMVLSLDSLNDMFNNTWEAVCGILSSGCKACRHSISPSHESLSRSLLQGCVGSLIDVFKVLRLRVFFDILLNVPAGQVSLQVLFHYKIHGCLPLHKAQLVNSQIINQKGLCRSEWLKNSFIYSTLARCLAMPLPRYASGTSVCCKSTVFFPTYSYRRTARSWDPEEWDKSCAFLVFSKFWSTQRNLTLWPYKAKRHT